MDSQDLKRFTLPDAPGIYFFKNGPKILYIGKATSLKDRVKSYFARDILMTRSPLIVKMLAEAKKIEFIETDSVLEALILEANEIKKHQPFYNSREKDDKSYNYVTITREDFPKVIVTRGYGTYGPFPYGGGLKEALKIIRKIFPFRDKCLLGKGRPCFNAQLGLCPGPCAGWISKKNYRKIIYHLRLFFEAKKPQLIKSLEKEMKLFAREQKFEDAEKVKRQIFSLKHIQDIALIKEQYQSPSTTLGAIRSTRIEAYDIAHMSGTNVVAVMTVVLDGELAKSQYRKFKIRLDSNDDILSLKEVLTRRLAHPEWRFPNLIVVDGGRGQLNAAREVLKKVGLDIAVASVVKDEKHKAREILGKNVQNSLLHKAIFLANAEAHRFAIGFHRRLRGKEFRI
ncbi:MAG: Excinuclease ABC C subunit domain protein [Parcubacteria group bacterium GW2011_GWF2_44_8b]|nr:MAG: Excinuclease ABC C subunit domain protein [Parcubacteria group bacterium GW2011_GWC1_43_30]KKT79922.1 MAG: Excinuclease ABC C subunit domain protein [Parcubacteria group bacterium GW2011_GWF2_44_8b]